MKTKHDYHDRKTVRKCRTEIGYKIAEDFGIKLYDKEMLVRAERKRYL